jgi:hypothetical protein
MLLVDLSRESRNPEIPRKTTGILIDLLFFSRSSFITLTEFKVRTPSSLKSNLRFNPHIHCLLAPLFISLSPFNQSAYYFILR